MIIFCVCTGHSYLLPDYVLRLVNPLPIECHFTYVKWKRHMWNWLSHVNLPFHIWNFLCLIYQHLICGIWAESYHMWIRNFICERVLISRVKWKLHTWKYSNPICFSHVKWQEVFVRKGFKQTYGSFRLIDNCTTLHYTVLHSTTLQWTELNTALRCNAL